MAQMRLIPSTYYNSSTSYLAVTDPNNMYANTDSTNYARVQNKQSGTTSYYIYLRGFNFDAIPDNATINSFTVKVKARETGVSTSSSYRPVLCNNTSALTGNSTTIGTSETVITFTGVTASWETIKGYGDNFGIRINCRRNNRNTTAYMYIYGAEILVDYTVPIPRTVTTSKSGNCTISPEGVTNLYEGDDFTLRIDSDTKPTVTDNDIDVTDKLVEKTGGFNYTVSTASGANYGFDLNSSGYYESTNKGKASSAAVCVVNMDLPVTCTVKFNLINYAEATYDYGLLSNIDTMLTNNASADTSNVYWSGKNNNDSFPQDVSYTVPAGTHYICVKYFKDSYTDSNNDTLQFKVEITPNEAFEPGVYYEYSIKNVSEDHLIFVTTQSLDEPKLYLKKNDNWKMVLKAYKKINNNWIEVSDIRSVFEDGQNYLTII